jgi:hypothetical protein
VSFAVSGADAVLVWSSQVARGFVDKLKQQAAEAAALAPGGGDAGECEAVAVVLSRRLHVLYVMDAMLHRYE